MIQSMLSNINLSKSLWTEAVNMTVYILNQFSTKAIPKMLFELLKGWKLSLQHVRIWGCPSK